MFEIKVGILVSYDYRHLYTSLPLIYEEADKIVLAIDEQRLTWSGISFDIDPGFFKWLENLDTKRKIIIYEDCFYKPELSTVECDTRERNMLAEKMGQGGWHIQIDSDEYFLNFKGFVGYLRQFEKIAQKKPVYIYVQFITLFKKIKEGFLYIDSFEKIPVATNHPEYYYIRLVKDTKPIFTQFLVVHQSWARTAGEIETKLKSWGHSEDFNVSSYFNMWNIIDSNNYMYLNNFHPLTPSKWSYLHLVPEPELNDVLKYVRENITPKTFKKNSFMRKMIRKGIKLLFK